MNNFIIKPFIVILQIVKSYTKNNEREENDNIHTWIRKLRFWI